MTKRSRSSNALGFLILGVLVIGGVASGLMLTWPLITGESHDPDAESVETIDDTKKVEEPKFPAEINFQPAIDEWAKTVSGNKSILIYDLALNKTVGEYNISENYNTASLYKLFVVYEGYKRVYTGEWNGEAMTGSTGYTINKCLDLAIRESYSPCAEALWAMIGHESLDKIIKTDWGITNSDILHLTSNVSDITAIMKRFYLHPDFDDPAMLETMWNSFLNQPKTTYDWRQGLPSGFSSATVYNKVGWSYNPDGGYWDIYHDTAIVKFKMPDNTTRDFIVTVMTNKIDFKYIKNFGTMLENAFSDFKETL